jgi:site-specific DNA-methyltransferase (adenine-specific)
MTARKTPIEQQSLPIETPIVKANALYYGDNLIWLKNHDHFPNDSIDLIYLDPPFNSNANYNLIFNESSGVKSYAQWRAFDDTWKWEKEASHSAILELTVLAPHISELIMWLSRHGDKKSTSMAAYLSMMAIRLMELHRVLKPSGSIYLHCDPTASHYLKLLMDIIFGNKNFRNEIAWCYRAGGVPRKGYPKKHDILLFYTKTANDSYTFNHEYMDYTEGTLKRGLTQIKGKYYDKGLRPEGTPIVDWWADIQKVLSPTAAETLGYPTQKSIALLERIINISSNKGDVILDPFCGCGTAVAAAEKLNRKWIGIDVTYLAINLIERRLANNFGDKIRNTYKVYGDPYDFASAKEMFDRDSKDKHAFELWALKLVKAQARSKDGGVDGIIGFLDPNNAIQRIVVQVKGGSNLSPGIIRDLIGTVQKESAAMGLLISLHTPTKGMYQDANHAGDYSGKERLYKKIQIRTISELIEQKKSFDLPYENTIAISKEQGKQELLF